MTSSWIVILSATLAVFTVAGVGAAARRLEWLTEAADATLLKLIVRLLMPALILHVIIGNPSLRTPADFLWPTLTGAGIVLLGFLVAGIAARLFHRPLGLESSEHRRAFTFCVGIGNYGYIPLPLSEALFGLGSGVTGVLLVHNVGVEVIFWTVGVMIVSGGLGRGWVRRLINPVVVSILLALSINFAGLDRHVPRFLDMALEMLGRTAIPVSLLLTGATVADVYQESRLREGWATILAACVLRLGILPVLMLLLAWVLPVPRELKTVIAIQAAMPAAVFPIILTRLYKADIPTAVRVVLGTSLVGLITIPLWLSLGLGFLKLL